MTPANILSKILGLELRSRLILAGIAVLLILILSWSTYLYLKPQNADIDLVLQNAFGRIPSITSYSQYIETKTQLSDRGIKIVGIYDVDVPHSSYAAYSTTTLSIRGDKREHVFTLDNVAIGDDVYTKVETIDTLLIKSIQSSSEWLHFKNTTIPKSFTGISVPGPIQDNLQILSNGGTWLTLVDKIGTEKLGQENFVHYTFRLSGKKPVQDSPLSAIINRVGTSGTIDVWIDPISFEPRVLRFTNDPYISTTTIRFINSVSTITPPPSIGQ